MMTGTASLPHILMRYFTTPTVRAARKSVAWSLFFIFLLYFTAPCLATLTKLQLLDPNLADGHHRQAVCRGGRSGVDQELVGRWDAAYFRQQS